MGKRGNNYFSRFRYYVASVLLEHRWLLLILLSASAFIFEILEHQNIDNPVDAHFVREVVFFGIIYPLAVGLLVSALLQAQRQRNFILRQQEIEQKLNRELMSASNWEELCNKIVNFPATVAPAMGVRLFSVSEENNALNLEADWWLVEPLGRPALQSPTPLGCCGVVHHTLEQHPHLFLSGNYQSPSSLREYCLVLFKDHRWLGVMFLYMRSAEHLSSDQISILNNIAPTMASAIDTARLQNRLDMRTVAIQNERERIARQLHDTLGQNLAYLRLKLDQMSMQNTLSEITFIQQDLERMRDIAHEAHEQVRQTLVSLKSERGASLTDLLLAQAQAVAEQAGFMVHPHISGEIIALPSTTQRKIHAIFREALYNVQRHARANTVHLSIIWDISDPSLTISLEDDGVGFEPDQAPAHGHFGLLIMQQRAEEIYGQLTITTAPSKGTRVVLRYPLSRT